MLKTERFDIFYYPEMENLARLGASFAEEAADELENKFAFALKDRTPIIFYAANLHFKQTNTIPDFIPDGVGGFYESLKGRVVIPSNGNIRHFRRVIRHELVHVFTFNLFTRVMRDYRQALDRSMPLWFTEGIAEYWSGEPDYQHEMIMRDAVASNYITRLEDLDRISGTYVMYKQGEAFCRFISETYGEEKLLQFIRYMWKFDRFDQLLPYVLNEPFRKIDAKWMDWVRVQYLPEMPQSSTPNQVSEPIFYRGFGMKPTFYRAKSGKLWVYFVGVNQQYGSVFRQEIDSLNRPIGRLETFIQGEKSERFEAFHYFESRMDISENGILAFVTKSGENDALHLYDVEANRWLATYKFAPLIAMYSPNWKKREEVLTFSGIAQNGYSDIYTFNPQSQELTKITNDFYNDTDPVWHPDGKSLVFSSDRGMYGKEGAENLFQLNVTSGEIHYLSNGKSIDQHPIYKEDGTLLFTRALFENGKWSAQNIWVQDTTRHSRPLTRFTGVAYNPIWTPNGQVVFNAVDRLRFTIRSLNKADSLLQNAKIQPPPPPDFNEAWQYASLSIPDSLAQLKYKRRYSLDAASAQVSQNSVYGTGTGGQVVFSDLLGDDYWMFTLYSTEGGTRNFFKRLNFQALRYERRKRVSTLYGVYRNSGLRYDITDPDALTQYPVFWETQWGGFGGLQYPISHFTRLELSSSLAYSDKAISFRGLQRKAVLLGNSISLIHDNALYGMTGPIAGFKSHLSLGYTTDIYQSNVNYYSLIGDVRYYKPLLPEVQWAIRAMGRMNVGREARLFYLGGSWDLRGFPNLAVRGTHNWFASTELRFPIFRNPSLLFPPLEYLGIGGLRGALFFDAAHTWKDEFRRRYPQIYAGETLAATGIGFRLSVFGALVLRYDIGYRYEQDFALRKPFRQFFFGWDF